MSPGSRVPPGIWAIAFVAVNLIGSIKPTAPMSPAFNICLRLHAMVHFPPLFFLLFFIIGLHLSLQWLESLSGIPRTKAGVPVADSCTSFLASFLFIAGWGVRELSIQKRRL